MKPQAITCTNDNPRAISLYGITRRRRERQILLVLYWEMKWHYATVVLSNETTMLLLASWEAAGKNCVCWWTHKSSSYRASTDWGWSCLCMIFWVHSVSSGGQSWLIRVTKVSTTADYTALHQSNNNTLQWWWCLKSPASQWFNQPFIQVQIKENTKAPHHWPFVRGLGIHRWLVNSLAKGPVTRKMFPLDVAIMSSKHPSWFWDWVYPIEYAHNVFWGAFQKRVWALKSKSS